MPQSAASLQDGGPGCYHRHATGEKADSQLVFMGEVQTGRKFTEAVAKDHVILFWMLYTLHDVTF